MRFHPSSSLAALIAAQVRPGRVIWIGVRPGRRVPMQALQQAKLEAGCGMVGDRYGSPGGARQLTLIASESLVAIASHLDREAIDLDALRRNIVVSGINLLALKGRRFSIGTAVLEASGECHPCSRMEEILGIGGYNAVRGLGGITARVLGSGEVRIGDTVAPLSDTDVVTQT